VVEDTTYTADDIRQRFGNRAARLVLEVSEDTNLSREERKTNYLEALEYKACDDAAAISAADLLANRLDMLINLKAGDDIWKRAEARGELQRKLDQDNERIRIIKIKCNSPIVQELERVTAEVHQFFTSKQ
jgi:(p)ppGpp synthase/HD superfamily hydrolase